MPHGGLNVLAASPPSRGSWPTAAADGAGIEVEVWELGMEAFGRLVAAVPAPLVIGTVALADGSAVKGLLCEPRALTDAREITAFGSWREYRSSLVA